MKITKQDLLAMYAGHREAHPEANDNIVHLTMRDPLYQPPRGDWMRLNRGDKIVIGVFFAILALAGLYFGISGYENMRLWMEARMLK